MQPYPSHLVQRLTLGDGAAVTIRPIRPDDEGIEQQFVRNLSDDRKMLQLTARLGFNARFDESDPRVMRVEAKLGQA
jgi:hypothetical protein